MKEMIRRLRERMEPVYEDRPDYLVSTPHPDKAGDKVDEMGPLVVETSLQSYGDIQINHTDKVIVRQLGMLVRLGSDHERLLDNVEPMAKHSESFDSAGELAVSNLERQANLLQQKAERMSGRALWAAAWLREKRGQITDWRSRLEEYLDTHEALNRTTAINAGRIVDSRDQLIHTHDQLTDVEVREEQARHDAVKIELGINLLDTHKTQGQRKHLELLERKEEAEERARKLQEQYPAIPILDRQSEVLNKMATLSGEVKEDPEEKENLIADAYSVFGDGVRPAGYTLQSHEALLLETSIEDAEKKLSMLEQTKLKKSQDLERNTATIKRLEDQRTLHLATRSNAKNVIDNADTSQMAAWVQYLEWDPQLRDFEQEGLLLQQDCLRGLKDIAAITQEVADAVAGKETEPGKDRNLKIGTASDQVYAFERMKDLASFNEESMQDLEHAIAALARITGDPRVFPKALGSQAITGVEFRKPNIE